MAAITQQRVAELLAEARARVAALQQPDVVAAITNLQQEQARGTTIEVSNLGITEANAAECGAEILADVLSTPAESIEPEQLAVHEEPHKVLGVARDDIIYNEKQQQAIDRGVAGEDVVLIGAAGTGKTTTQRGLAKALIASRRIPKLGRSTKWLRSGVYGVLVCSFTNKATNNIRHALPEELKPHALTIHKTLEFAPVFYEIEDPANPGTYKKTMRFEPTRTRYNPLPGDLRLIIIEESGSVSVELHELLMDACPHRPQMIYLGDIQQLPPVFGSAILGFKMLELPVIELTEIYRQALNSPIISLAWKVLGGDPTVFSSKAVRTRLFHPVLQKEIPWRKIPALEELSLENSDGKVMFQPWQNSLSADHALITLVKQLTSWIDSGYYNPGDDIILCPFNVNFGTIEINKGVAQFLGRKRHAIVHEVIAGYNKHYLAEGDRVLFEKEDAFITRIVRNGEYISKSPQSPNEFLDRWGHLRDEDMGADELSKLEKQEATEASGDDEFDLAAIEKFIDAAASEDDERVNAASHLVTVKILATEDERELTTAAEINQLLGGYAITVHKAQGSEWEKVFFVMHNSHATMNQRELLYTAVTRARKHLHIICEPNTFEKGIMSQKIKGNTIAEKAEWFKGKVAEREKMLLEKAKAAAGTEDPLQLAFSKIPEWDQLARDAVHHWWKVAQHHYEKLQGIPVPSFGWRIKGSAAGVARYNTREIFCSPVYLFLDANDMIADTIPHEVAHIVANEVYRDKNHGGGWREVMKRFGRDPTRSIYHDLGKLPAALRKVLEEAKAATAGSINTDEAE